MFDCIALTSVESGATTRKQNATILPLIKETKCLMCKPLMLMRWLWRIVISVLFQEERMFTSFLATFMTCKQDPLLMNSITSHSSFSCTNDA